MFDVLVIGSGMAGSVAAFAARQQGATVAVASRGFGVTAMSTGAMDIAFAPALSPVHRVSTQLASHVVDIVAHRKRHPYGVLGVDRTCEAIMGGYGLLSRMLEHSGLDLLPLRFDGNNIGLPSSLGTVMPAATALAPHCGLDLAKPVDAPWGVVHITGDIFFDAVRVIAGLQTDARALCHAAPELLPIQIAVKGRGPFALARRFDDGHVLESVIASLKGPAADVAGLLMPPVLGLKRFAKVRRMMSDALGIPVVEALAHIPSVPGFRLQHQIDSFCGQQDIAYVGAVERPLFRGGHLMGAVTTDGIDVRAHALVLASGRFITCGVALQSSCRESLFGLPVFSDIGPLEDDGPLSIVREMPTESHPLMTAGVGIDANVQPLLEGKVAYDCLFAAGNVIGGFASRYALCSDGVALATGWLAGRAAASCAGRV